MDVLNTLNLEYSKQVFNQCVQLGTDLFMLGRATYGLGELGYKDDHEIIEKLKPLNPYGISKNEEFDKWLLKQPEKPYFWAGLKFFNVYGPNEYHKGRMASVILHAYHQIQENGQMKLFRSHNPIIRMESN